MVGFGQIERNGANYLTAAALIDSFSLFLFFDNAC